MQSDPTDSRSTDDSLQYCCCCTHLSSHVRQVSFYYLDSDSMDPGEPKSFRYRLEELTKYGNFCGQICNEIWDEGEEHGVFDDRKAYGT